MGPPLPPGKSRPTSEAFLRFPANADDGSGDESGGAGGALNEGAQNNAIYRTVPEGSNFGAAEPGGYGATAPGAASLR
jgi:hypothetical protein